MDEPKNDNTQARTQSKRDYLRLFVCLVALGLFCYGAYGVVQWWQTTKKPVTPAALSTAPITNSTDNPSEAKISPNAEYKVAADMPRRIILASIASEGFIQRVDVDQRNAVAVPNNVHMAGWYVKSVKPGEAGLSIIDGHVSGKYTDGIFKRLGKLKGGDKFAVEFGDLRQKSFEVMSVKTVSVEDANNELFAVDGSTPNLLKLITCGGKFDAKAQQFDKRVIVSAKLI